MGWRILVFYPEPYSINTVVYFDWKTVIYICGQCRTIRGQDFLETDQPETRIAYGGHVC
jgi:hypothetical protein